MSPGSTDPPRRCGRPRRPPAARGVRHAGGSRARREHRGHRLRQRLRVGAAALDDPVDHLSGEEQRVATRALGHLLDEHRPRRRRRRCRTGWVTRAFASSRGSGSSVIRVALMRPPAQPGRRSRSRGRGRSSAPAPASSAPGTRSGRACPRRPSGCPTAKINGSRRPAASTTVRTAENSRSRICWRILVLERLRAGAGRRLDAEGRPSAAAIRSGDSSVSDVAEVADTAAELVPGRRRVVGVGDVERAANDLTEAQ